MEGQDYPLSDNEKHYVKVISGGYANAPRKGARWKPDPQHSYPTKAPKGLWKLIDSYAEWYDADGGGGNNREETDKLLIKWMNRYRPTPL